MSIETEVIPIDDFEEIGEFEMPLEKDYMLKQNIDREIALLNEYARKHGYKTWSIISEGE